MSATTYAGAAPLAGARTTDAPSATRSRANSTTWPPRLERWDIPTPILDTSPDLRSDDGHLSLLIDGRLGVIEQYRCDTTPVPSRLARKLGAQQEHHWFYRFEDLALGSDGKVWFRLGSVRIPPRSLEAQVEQGLLRLVEGQNPISYRAPLRGR